MQSLETGLDPVSPSFLCDQKHMFIVSYYMVDCFLETQIHFSGPHACAAALNIIKPLACWVFHTYQPIMNGISSLIELLDP